MGGQPKKLFGEWGSPYCDLTDVERTHPNVSCVKTRAVRTLVCWVCLLCSHQTSVVCGPIEFEKQIVHWIRIGPGKDYCEHGCSGTAPPAMQTTNSHARQLFLSTVYDSVHRTLFFHKTLFFRINSVLSSVSLCAISAGLWAGLAGGSGGAGNSRGTFETLVALLADGARRSSEAVFCDALGPQKGYERDSQRGNRPRV